MQPANLALRWHPSGDHLMDIPSISSLRIPSPQASVISLRSNGMTISERFESLIRQGSPKALLETPLRFFSAIPFQHLQMALSLLGFIRVQNPWNLLSSPLGQQVYLRHPLFQRAFQNLIQDLKIPTPLVEKNAAAFSPATVPMAPAETFNQESNYLKSAQANLQQKIYTPEPETRQRLSAVNAKRAQAGKPPIDFVGTTRKIEDIMNNPSLSDNEKKKQVGDLRKELGLSKKDMKKLFTKRLARIYQEAANQLKTHLNQLKESAKEAERIYGKDSAQAVAARERLQAAQNQLEPTLKKWEHQASLYKSMFPSFWSKIGGFFKAIGKGLLKVGKVFTKIMNFVTPFLRFIPGIGQMVAFGWGALKGLVQAIKGDWKGFLGGFLNFAKGIPGVPPFLTKTSEYLSHLISPLRPKPDPHQEGVPPGALG